VSSVEKPIYLEDRLEAVNESGRLGFRAKALPTWCPGCGYFAVAEAEIGMNGLFLRELPSWSARATSSLPVPLSP